MSGAETVLALFVAETMRRRNRKERGHCETYNSTIVDSLNTTICSEYRSLIEAITVHFWPLRSPASNQQSAGSQLRLVRNALKISLGTLDSYGQASELDSSLISSILRFMKFD